MSIRNKKIKLVLVDDHVSVRTAYKQVLEDISDFKVIGEARNGRELFQILPELSPDIILLDLEMPIMNGKEALVMLSKKYPEVKVLILSTHGDFYVNEFINVGARGCLCKNCGIEEVINAIYSIYHEGYCVSKSVSKSIALDEVQKIQLHKMLNQTALSEKEIAILKLMCEGNPTKQMGDILSISVDTVNWHKKNIFKKTGLNSIGPLAQYAIRNGFIKLD